MLVAPVEKPVASASYGFVRFIGGGLAPYFAGRLAAAFNVHVPFYLGAAAVLAAIVVLATGHSLLTNAEQTPAEEVTGSPAPTAALRPAELPTGIPGRAPARPVAVDHSRPIVVAIDASSHAAAVTGAATELARLLDCPIEVLHVFETDVLEEEAIAVETLDGARTVVADNLDRLHAAGIRARGHLANVVGAHGGAGRRIAEFAEEYHARMIVIGTPADSEMAGIFGADLARQLVSHADRDVLIVSPARVDEPSRAEHTVS
jgi:nucleotide-binding universal stress UspA family protein